MSKCKKFLICLLILHIHGSRSLASNFSDLIDPLILGGTDASFFQIFFLVSICLRQGPFKCAHICGGSLITQRAVISAAHCFNNIPPKYFKLVMGILKQSEETKYTLRFSVNTIIAHADYDSRNYANDIVIYFAKGRVPSDHFVHPIKLPENEVEPSSTCKIYGWGIVSAASLADTAQQAKVELFSRSDCVAAYPEPAYRYTNGMICAGNRKGGIDACQGDSGGPLIYDDVLIGIVSFGVGCALPQYPGVYTNVFYYRDWINETLRNSSKTRTLYFLCILLIIIDMLKFVT